MSVHSLDGENTLNPAFETLSGEQQALIALPFSGKICLEGIVGSGKTTAAVARLEAMLAGGIPGESVLILVPQRTLADPYLRMINHGTRSPGGEVEVMTLGGLARRMVQLYWPMIAEEAGFIHPVLPPVFLTLELAQYYMAQTVGPVLDAAPEMFTSLAIHRNRLFSQILDNLNKAAVVGLPYSSIGQRLMGAWTGESSQTHIYQDAQTCADIFRQACLARNLLDFSLQIEVFRDHIWPLPLFQTNLQTRFRHLLVDNIEEDTPVTHDILLDWLPNLDSALIVADRDGGYRRFLGADPESALRLIKACGQRITFEKSFVLTDDHETLTADLANALGNPIHRPGGDPRRILRYAAYRFQPEMMDWIAEETADLIQNQGVSPGEIAILSPFLSDALRFSLVERLKKHAIRARSHRPSRALCEEPAVQSLLTLSRMAHPQWGQAPSEREFANALTQSIEGFDLVRARLLAANLYRVQGGVGILEPFEEAPGDIQQRVTFLAGERWEMLRSWLIDYQTSPQEAFDIFLSRLFGELLSQPGFGFHANYDAGAATANLIESVQKFRWVVGGSLAKRGKALGREYLQLVREGLVAAQYIRSWEAEEEDAVLLAPAFTFLMGNRPIDYQFWINIGSRGWSERLYQPITHPYVLSRNWAMDCRWGDEDELAASRQVVRTLCIGLVRRCRKRIYLGMSEIGEQGYEQRGLMLQALQRVFIRAAQEGDHV
ncbi:MAG: ATP-dependent helicase [Anaerolineales bacterium]|nr:ATP-dependent helicase [Anaerolineales bacterium]